MNLIERAKNILLKPKETWGVIDAEPADVATLFTRYAMILAAIPAVCGFIGMSLIGFGGFGVTIRVPFVSGLVNMVVSYVLSLGGIFVLGLIIDALAPTFGGQKNPIQAQKVAVYASTAALLGGIFNLLPALSVLGFLAALYSIYLLYTGLPVLMRSLPEKSVVYTVVVIVAAIVVGVVIGTVSSLLLPRGNPLMGAAPGSGAITMDTPGGKVTIDTAGLEAAGKKMEEAARKMEAAQKSQDPAAIAAAGSQAAAAAVSAMGGGQAIAAQSLKAALPDTLAGLPRTGFEVQDGAALGLPTSQARAQYGSDDKQVRLEIVDVGGLGQMAAMAMGMAQGEKETPTSAEKTWQEGGRTLHTRVDKDGSRAEFKTILKNGVVVSLEGDKVGVKELQGYMSQVDLGALEGLQRKGKS